MEDRTIDKKYPKTLIIRSEMEGAVWQLYHVENFFEAEMIAQNANNNGFEGVTLEDYQSDSQQTWENWRDTPGGSKVVEDAKLLITNKNK